MIYLEYLKRFDFELLVEMILSLHFPELWFLNLSSSIWTIHASQLISPYGLIGHVDLRPSIKAMISSPSLSVAVD